MRPSLVNGPPNALMICFDESLSRRFVNSSAFNNADRIFCELPFSWKKFQSICPLRSVEIAPMTVSIRKYGLMVITASVTFVFDLINVDRSLRRTGALWITCYGSPKSAAPVVVTALPTFHTVSPCLSNWRACASLSGLWPYPRARFDVAPPKELPLTSFWAIRN